MMWPAPDATASSTTYWMVGLSTSGSISFGCALVAGRNRVPRPAAGNTAFLTVMTGARSQPTPHAGETEYVLLSRTASRRPTSRRRWLVLHRAHLDLQLLHPVPEAPLGDAEDLGGARLNPVRL